MKYYTSIKPGSRIKIPSILRDRGGLLLHVDSRSCTSCILTVQAVWKAAQANHVPTVVYSHGGSPAEYESLYRQFKAASIVEDDLGAYAMLHGIKHYPVVVVVDKLGTVKYVGAPGGTKTFDVDKCIAALDRITLAEDAENSNATVFAPIHSAFNISTHDGHKLSPLCVMQYVRAKHSFVVLDPSSKEIYRISTDGKAEPVVKLASLNLGITPYRPYLIYVTNKGDSVLISDTDMLSAKPSLPTESWTQFVV